MGSVIDLYGRKDNDFTKSLPVQFLVALINHQINVVFVRIIFVMNI